MSDKQKKRYYWLKLKEDFFEEDTIAWLEEQPNGKEYCLIYLKLCLKSLKSDGLLARTVGNMMIPYDAETLAKITNSSSDTIKVAMDLFDKIGLIQVMETGEIYLNQLNELVGTETEYAKQKRLQRAKEKQLTIGQSQDVVQDNVLDNVHQPEIESVEKERQINDSQTLGQCPDNVDQSIELEIELEIEKELQLQQEKKSSGVWLSFSTYQKLWLFPNHIQKEHLVELINTYSDELVNAAIILAGKNDVPKNRSLNFVEACLREWNNANVKTVDEARVYTVNRSKMHKQVHQKKSYGNVRKEQLPEWASNPEQIPQVEEDPAVKAELQRRLAEYQRKKAENDGA